MLPPSSSTSCALHCRLKVQQGLLVDFSAFPKKFVDLLELCLVESGKENPKYARVVCTCALGLEILCIRRP